MDRAEQTCLILLALLMDVIIGMLYLGLVLEPGALFNQYAPWTQGDRVDLSSASSCETMFGYGYLGQWGNLTFCTQVVHGMEITVLNGWNSYVGGGLFLVLYWTQGNLCESESIDPFTNSAPFLTWEGGEAVWLSGYDPCTT